MVFDSTKDLAWDKTLKVIRRETNVRGGEFVFDPESFKEEARSFRLEAHRLSQQALVEYGKLATHLREHFKSKAEMQ